MKGILSSSGLNNDRIHNYFGFLHLGCDSMGENFGADVNP